MTEGGILDLIYRAIITPIVLWIVWKLQRKESSFEELKSRIALLEKSEAVNKVMYDNVMSNVLEMKSDIKSIAENMRYLERRRHDDPKD